MSPDLLNYPREVQLGINGVTSETEMFPFTSLWVVILLTP